LVRASDPVVDTLSSTHWRADIASTPLETCAEPLQVLEANADRPHVTGHVVSDMNRFVRPAATVSSDPARPSRRSLKFPCRRPALR